MLKETSNLREPGKGNWKSRENVQIVHGIHLPTAHFHYGTCQRPQKSGFPLQKKHRRVSDSPMLFLRAGLSLQLEGFAVGALVHSRICFVGAHGDAVQGAVILIGTMVGALLNSAFDGRICFAGLTGHREVLLQILQIHPVPAAGAGGTRRLKEAESACFSRRI